MPDHRRPGRLRPAAHEIQTNTYSIVARDPQTGALGVAVQTHQMGVGRVVPWLRPGSGALATQALSNVSYGPMGLAMLHEGLSAQQVVDGLTASDPNARRRQLAVVDAQGNAAAFTGTGCIPEAGHRTGDGFSVQANMMTRPTVVDAMYAAFTAAAGDLAERMLAALEAAQAEDGDIRGMQSAALIVVPGEARYDWQTTYDLRVDEHAQPVDELGRLVRLRRAQLIDTEGHLLLEQGKLDEALAKWQAARELAPELEEIAFWQAVNLADVRPTEDAIERAAALLQTALAGHERRSQWLDLISRLAACGMLTREGADRELLAALEARESGSQ